MSKAEGEGLAYLRLEVERLARNRPSARGEIPRLVGGSQEKWKAEQLRVRGYEVTQDGRTGQPDIIAKHSQIGELRVFSCKCLEFTQKAQLPIKELRPEMHKALELHAPLMLSVWNLADDSEQELMLDPMNISKSVDLRPI